MLLITIGLRKRIKGIVSIIFASLKKDFFRLKVTIEIFDHQDFGP